ncbi:MAG: hypothetical protein LUE92_02075 [Clostridiales bacterium]|nr:hypothetical protein [Clostridiales bacterium]
MEVYRFIFVILVYRNHEDMVELIESIEKKVENYKVIVVNAFYDNDSEKIIHEIAKKYDCDYLKIENKGYSFGNNRGIEWANQHYEYDYVVISNPDIVIAKFDNDLSLVGVVAPEIICASGKKQNPMLIYENKLSELLVYHGYKNNHKILLIIGIGINKVIREVYTKFGVGKGQVVYRKIYQPHGSFIVLDKSTATELFPVFDENIFLFAEESVFALRLKRGHKKVTYTNSISVRHKEDGSMHLSDLSVDGEMKKANLYYYEQYRKGRASDI